VLTRAELQLTGDGMSDHAVRSMATRLITAYRRLPAYVRWAAFAGNGRIVFANNLEFEFNEPDIRACYWDGNIYFAATPEEGNTSWRLAYTGRTKMRFRRAPTWHTLFHEVGHAADYQPLRWIFPRLVRISGQPRFVRAHELDCRTLRQRLHGSAAWPFTAHYRQSATETYAELFAWIMSERQDIRLTSDFTRRFPDFDKRQWFPRCTEVVRADLRRIHLTQNSRPHTNKVQRRRIEQQWVD